MKNKCEKDKPPSQWNKEIPQDKFVPLVEKVKEMVKDREGELWE